MEEAHLATTFRESHDGLALSSETTSRYEPVDVVRLPPAVSSTAIRAPLNATLNRGGQSLHERSPRLEGTSVASERAPDSEPSRYLSIRDKYWNPYWLRRDVLICSAILFGLLAVALVLLWHFCELNQGFPLLTDNHYAWTYGPTAVLVIVISCWRQIDFWCKTLLPWQELKNGPATADKSILLDYISPIPIVCAWQALKKQHMSVVATSLGLLLLQALTIISTGLMVLTPTRLTMSNVNLVALNKLNWTGGDNYDFWDPSPAYIAYAVLNKDLAYPEGTQRNLVYPMFRLAHTHHATGNIASAKVDTLFLDLECEKATVAALPPQSEWLDQLSTLGLVFSSRSCNSEALQGAQFGLRVTDPRYEACPSQQLSGSWQQVNCSGKVGGFPQQGPLLFTMADISYTQGRLSHSSNSSVHDAHNRTEWPPHVRSVSGIVCNPSYAIEKALVEYDYSQTPPKVAVTGPITNTKATLPGFSFWNLSAKLADLDGDPWVMYMYGNSTALSLDREEANWFFGLMSVAAGLGYGSFLDESRMIEAATEVWQNVMTQWAAINLVTGGALPPIEGQLASNQNRLHVSERSLWPMVSGSTLLLILSLLLAWKRPHNVVPRNVQPIGSIALILSQSDHLQNLLQDTGRMDMSVLQNSLSSQRYSSNVLESKINAPNFAIEVFAHSKEKASRFQKPLWRNAARKWWRNLSMRRKNIWNFLKMWWSKSSQRQKHPQRLTMKRWRPKWFTRRDHRNQHHQMKWWRPLALNHGIFGLTLCLPISLIVVLEILQQHSNNNRGILALPNDRPFLDASYTRFLPALVMFLVAILYDSLDFTVSLFAPFYALRSGQVAAEHGLMSSLLGKVPFRTIYLAFSHGYWGAIFSAIAALIGSVLTIIVSGLYTVESTSVSDITMVHRLDHFKTTWADSATNDNQAAVLTSLTESLNVSYSHYTYGELAFPAVELTGSVSKILDGGGNATFNTRLPSLRASLNCTFTPAHIIDLGQSTIGTYYTENLSTIMINSSLSNQCAVGSHMPYVTLSATFVLQSNPGYAGGVFDLPIGSGASNPAGCPSLVLIFGYFDVTLNEPSNATAMVCHQLLQEVQTDVTFLLPGWTVSDADPPKPLEDTVRYIPNGPNGSDSFEWHISHNMLQSLIVFDRFTTNAMTGTQRYMSGQMDSFFEAVLFGRQPIDPAMISGPLHEQNLLHAVTAFYRRYMAQAISQNMRVNTTETPLEVFYGTFADSDLQRLKQNNASKITLQVMLGIMAVCGLLAYNLTSMRDTLPHNPCSIAGTASLLAGSEMCSGRLAKLIPAGAEWLTDEELKEHKVWNGWTFSMGWWEWKYGEQSRFGIDVGEAERSIVPKTSRLWTLLNALKKESTVGNTNN